MAQRPFHFNYVTSTSTRVILGVQVYLYQVQVLRGLYWMCLYSTVAVHMWLTACLLIAKHFALANTCTIDACRNAWPIVCGERCRSFCSCAYHQWCFAKVREHMHLSDLLYFF